MHLINLLKTSVRKLSKNRRKIMSKKKKEMTQEQRLCHLPNYLHLDACRQGGRVFRNKKKYTRKGKSRFNAQSYMD